MICFIICGIFQFQVEPWLQPTLSCVQRFTDTVWKSKGLNSAVISNAILPFCGHYNRVQHAFLVSRAVITCLGLWTLHLCSWPPGYHWTFDLSWASRLSLGLNSHLKGSISKSTYSVLQCIVSLDKEIKSQELDLSPQPQLTLNSFSLVIGFCSLWD